MKITTLSGTQYRLRNVEDLRETEDGSALDEIMGWRYRAEISRVSDAPMTHVYTGDEMDLGDGEWHKAVFPALPEIGWPFPYLHDAWGGCTSSTVVEVEDDDA